MPADDTDFTIETPALAPKPVVLCILDGWGHRNERAHNAIAQANAPHFRQMWNDCPHGLLKTDGLSVGLPEGQMGNSEVGHMTIGAGRVLMQDLPRIDAAIDDGLDKLESLNRFIDRLRAAQARIGRAPTVHMLGLISPGGIHSHQRHAAAFANHIARAGFPVAIHIFLDGRDRPPQNAADDLADFRALLDEKAPVKIATFVGRYYAMDRDNRWHRIEEAYDLIVDGKGAESAGMEATLRENYAQGTGDELMPAHVTDGYTGMQDGDALLCINFRADRARQIMAALVLPEFPGFDRKRVIDWSAVATMTEYSRFLPDMDIFFPPQTVENDLGAWVAAHGRTQLRIAETEKYAHVTYFFNGGQEPPREGEERIFIPSPKVATYDLAPEMMAADLTDELVQIVADADVPDLIVVNYANPDMVGHSGRLAAAVKAVEAVDECLGRLKQAVVDRGGVMIVTADHGNVEEMWDTDKNTGHTQHTLNPVPVILFNGPKDYDIYNGTLADLAPTLLELLNLPAPAEMTGRSLLRHD